MNLAFDWFQECVFNQPKGDEEWNRTWADIFDPPADHAIAEGFDVDEDAGPVIAIARAGGQGVSESTADGV